VPIIFVEIPGGPTTVVVVDAGGWTVVAVDLSIPPMVVGVALHAAASRATRAIAPTMAHSLVDLTDLTVYDLRCSIYR
jgi:hypothetical protein